MPVTMSPEMAAKVTAFTQHYIRHQPKYQRGMMISFTAYVFISTYHGLSGGGKKKAKAGVPVPGQVAAPAPVDEKPDVARGKGGRRRKRAPRVEVSLSTPP